jgi:carbon starvation protein
MAALALLVLAALGIAYRLYGGFVARRLALDPTTATPATRVNDGIDFVPTRPFYLLGQHFSAIAAAGPIAGPIVAGIQFGWVPCLLWIGLGVVFIGAVHDMSTLVASVRHDARSIADVVRQYVGTAAWYPLVAFIWLALVYVVVAFCEITAGTFVSGDAELAGLEFRFNPGGAVALASVLYLGLAVLMGLGTRFLRVPTWLSTLVFVPATLACVYLGTEHSTLLALGGASPKLTWEVAILLYCAVASVVPVWALLQPRGYLGGFVLYLALGSSVVGLLFGGFTVEQPAFRGFAQPGSTGLLFPFLFVTIACGACSGFHGLVCSGTTSKQIARETHCRPIGYGAMLLEGFVAFIALTTVMIASDAELQGKAAGAVYGQGLGKFIGVFLGEERVLLATTFGAMAFSTFVFDTLDVATRLGRYLLQELFGWRGRAGAVAGTLITCGAPAVILASAPDNAYREFWTLFGTSNQLLAALSLLGVTMWLRRSGKPFLFSFLPMMFVLVVTLTSLSLLTVENLARGREGLLNGATAALLLALAVAVLWLAVRRARRPAAESSP